MLALSETHAHETLPASGTIAYDQFQTALQTYQETVNLNRDTQSQSEVLNNVTSALAAQRKKEKVDSATNISSPPKKSAQSKQAISSTWKLFLQNLPAVLAPSTPDGSPHKLKKIEIPFSFS